MNCSLKICWANHLLFFQVDWFRNIPMWIPSLTRNERNRPNYTQRSECKLRGMICRISDSMGDFGTEVHIAIYIAIGANMNRCWLRWKIMLTHRYHTYTTFYLRSWLVVIRRAHPQFNSLLVRIRILQSTPRRKMTRPCDHILIWDNLLMFR